jgi:hypothetical protein
MRSQSQVFIVAVTCKAQKKFDDKFNRTAKLSAMSLINRINQRLHKSSPSLYASQHKLTPSIDLIGGCSDRYFYAKIKA